MQYHDDMAVIDGAHLRWCRERSGYTPTQFAREIGISVDYLRNIEDGHRFLKRRPDLIKLIADTLDVPQQKLMKAAPGEQMAS